MSSGETLQDLDRQLFDPLLFSERDPHALWARLRREDPVRLAVTPYGHPFWSLTRYADAAHVLRDCKLFSSRLSGATLPLDAAMADPQ